MKKIFLALSCIIAFALQSYGQQNGQSIKTDKNTEYFDENGKKITPVMFDSLLKKGGFTTEPLIKEGKIVNIKLNKAGSRPADGEYGHAAATSDQMLSPDANTKYYDENGNPIDQMALFTKIQNGGYTFEPEIVDGKVKLLKLKKNNNALTKGTVAKDFTIIDLKGKKWSLKELKGKTVVLNFWFTSCIPCIKEMPELNALVEKYKHNKNIIFLAVTYDNKEKVEPFLTKKEFKFNIIAGQDAMIKDYSISTYPTTLVIDEQNRITLSLTTYSDSSVQKIDEEIAKLQSGK